MHHRRTKDKQKKLSVRRPMSELPYLGNLPGTGAEQAMPRTPKLTAESFLHYVNV